MASKESEARLGSSPLIDDATLDRLLARIDAEELELLGPDGVLTEFTSRIMNLAMQTELTDQLGYETCDPAGWGSSNTGNGSSLKTVLTYAGSIPVMVFRDRYGAFESELIPMHRRYLHGFNELNISLFARGMTTSNV